MFCLNDVMCKFYDYLGIFSCMCKIGFIGEKCEVDIDDCVLDFCILNVYC